MGCPWPYHSPWEVEGRENWCTHYTTRKETQGGCFAYEEVSATLSALPLLLTAGYWHMREEGERGPRWTGRVSPRLKERYHKLKKERFHPSLWSQAASLWIEGLTPDNFSCSVTHKSCCWVVFTYLNDASPCVRVCVCWSRNVFENLNCARPLRCRWLRVVGGTVPLSLSLMRVRMKNTCMFSEPLQNTCYRRWVLIVGVKPSSGCSSTVIPGHMFAAAGRKYSSCLPTAT